MIELFNWYCSNILLLFLNTYILGMIELFNWYCSSNWVWEKKDKRRKEGEEGEGSFGRQFRRRKKEEHTPRERSTPGIEEIASTHFTLLFLAAYPTGVCSSHFHHSISFFSFYTS